MLHFMKNDHEIILRCKWGSESAASPAPGPRRSSGEGSGDKSPENWRANKYLRIKET